MENGNLEETRNQLELGGQPGPHILIEDEMKTSYLDYAMSVIVSRAIPDLRDGLKPVHRRILYAMYETGNTSDKAYRKSARAVGEVMGKYHPHGDSAIYDSLVRMAQNFSMSVPLLDGQGNFGSLDGDAAAAMRYTEVKMQKVANSLLADIDKNTVDFQDNYDGKDREPTVLPSRFPNMLVNGAGGIAVGMATNIPPHNLGEIINATLALIDNYEINIEELMAIVPAPDFPTGALILGKLGAKKAYTEGRGSVIVRSKTKIEEIRKDRWAIVVSEIPYQVNKSNLIEKIAEVGKERKIEGIAHVQDESDRLGVRIVIQLKRDATPEVVLNQLYKFTQLQTSFSCNMLALNGGRPEQLDLKAFLSAFVTFREEVVARRTAHDLRKARERSHVLCGLAVAVSNVDEIVETIRSSADPGEARDRLTRRRWPAKEIKEFILLIDDPSHKINDDGTYFLSQKQARAILELRLQRLTALGVSEVSDELKELASKIKQYLSILSSRDEILTIIKEELKEVREAYSTPRRSEIVDFDGDMDDEDLIEQEEMVVTVTQSGYIKRTALSEYREQKRGGKGSQGMNTKDEDIVTSLFIANTHTPLLFFTTDGIVYKIKTWRLPQGGRNSRGKAIINMLPIAQGVSIAAILPIDVPEQNWNDLQVFFSTSTGDVRRNALSDFTNVKANGKIAMKLPNETTLVGVKICSNQNDVMLTTSMGKLIRFPVSDVRVFKGRDSIGVRGIKLAANDFVVSMAIIRHVDASSEERQAYFKIRKNLSEEVSSIEQIDQSDPTEMISDKRFADLADQEEWILTVTAAGYGKRSSAHEYRVSSRGGQGIMAANLERREDTIISSFPVEDDDQIMLVTSTGQSIRCPVQGISRQSRTASGVTIFNTSNNEKVVSVAWIAEKNEPEIEN